MQKPQFEAVPKDNPASRAVYADIGVTEDGYINFEAPVIKRYSIQGIPYYFVMDESGSVVGQGRWNDIESMLR